ncbi:Tetratricopeptide repeat protein [Phycisphaerae bacterium RAS1]|nr:Tetratricopeptide repeat protein [Phycisphaerae bacterium RAS1]
MRRPESLARERSRLAAIFAAEPELIQAFIESDARLRTQSALIHQAALESVTANPDSAELCFYAAHAALHHADPSGAEQLLRRALAILPTHRDALILAGRLAIDAGLPERAEWLLQQALAAGGDYPDVHFLLGQSWQKQGQLSRARESYQRALALNEKYDRVRDALQTLTDRGSA